MEERRTKCQSPAEDERRKTDEHRLMVVWGPGRFPGERTDTSQVRGKNEVRDMVRLRMREAYRLPMLPKPFTIPIAADRLAGGRGMAFDTHTNVNANPAKKHEQHGKQGWARGLLYRSSHTP